jgi:hypothetical protein
MEMRGLFDGVTEDKKQEYRQIRFVAITSK